LISADSGRVYNGWCKRFLEALLIACEPQRDERAMHKVEQSRGRRT